MTSHTSGATDKPAADINQPSIPRKRRRRAPTTGAVEDCFACRKRQTKCDRKRPYCTQCIDLGKECSGYKTTLTWGVGVASRGKLRGLALPVANSTKASAATREPKPQAISPIKSPTSHEGQSMSGKDVKPNTTLLNSAPVTRSEGPATTTYEYSHISPSSPIPIPAAAPQPSPQLGFHVPGFGKHVDGYHALASKSARPHLRPRPLHRLQTSLVGSYDEIVLSASTGSLSAYSDSDYPSPGDFPYTPDEVPFSDFFFQSYTEPYFLQAASLNSTDSFHYADMPRSYPTVGDDMSSSISSDQSRKDSMDITPNLDASLGPASLSDIFYRDEIQVETDGQSTDYGFPLYSEPVGMNPIFAEEHIATNQLTAVGSTSIPRGVNSFHFYHLSPRMQFLLDYYDKAICPVLVAFDGPSNPYRKYILHLALASEGLQNAIAALSTNNIRMRGLKEVQRVGFNQAQLAAGSPVFSDQSFPHPTAQDIRDMHGNPTPEELEYKAASVEMLNAQLADLVRAKDDSALATLLILCLFHVCDSGFSKFKMQLAGVQRLLSMRDRNARSGFVGWVDMFFTWFDVMTSTVNDRETEIRGDSLDMLDLSANLGALEHLAGCEGRLFKLIARLGRLNLLSQNRPVRDRSSLEHTPRPSPKPKTAKDYYSLHYDRLDGNGWGTPLNDDSSDDTPDSEDNRHEFWTEWREIRERLREWELDATPPPGGAVSSAPPALSPGQRDLQHISEAFRYSALLYTERLAHPSLPPSAPNFQNLVAQALFHISEIGVTSCMNKFLLWPLFITGTECVDEEHRAIVRQRCIEIQRESGFFNNLSGLEVLERVWMDDDAAGEDVGRRRGGMGRQAFRWRNAMDRVDGEYIVI